MAEEGEAPMEGVPEETPEAPAEEAGEAPPEEAPAEEKPPEDEPAPEAEPEAAPEPPPEAEPEAAPEAPPEAPPEEAPEAAPEEAPEAAPEEAPEAAPEKPPEEAPEKPSEETPEKASEETPEKPAEEAPAKAAEEAPAKAAEEAPAKAPEEAPAPKAEKAKKEAPSKPAEKPAASKPPTKEGGGGSKAPPAPAEGGAPPPDKPKPTAPIRPSRKPCLVTRFPGSSLPPHIAPCSYPCPKRVPSPCESAPPPCTQPASPGANPCCPPVCPGRPPMPQVKPAIVKAPPGKIPPEEAPAAASAEAPKQDAGGASGKKEGEKKTESPACKRPTASGAQAPPQCAFPLRVDETLRSLSCLCPLVNPPSSIPCLVACSPDTKHCPLHNYPQKEPSCLRYDVPASVTKSMINPPVSKYNVCGACGQGGAGCTIHSYSSKRFFPAAEIDSTCPQIESTKSTPCMLPATPSRKLLAIGTFDGVFPCPGHYASSPRCMPCTEMITTRECVLAQGITRHRCVCGMHCNPPIPPCYKQDIIRRCGASSCTPSACRIHNNLPCSNPSSRSSPPPPCHTHSQCCGRH